MVAPEVFEAMLPYFKQSFGNPSSAHSYGKQARQAIEQSRQQIADLIGASPSEIFFTSGATESDNLAITGSIRTFGLTHAITSKIEHHAVLHCLQNHVKESQLEVNYVNLDEKGRLDLNHLEVLLSQYPGSLVSLMHGNNEIGNLNDIELIGSLCKKYQAIFHSDTVQTIGQHSIHVEKLNVNFIVGSGHKFHGPKGIGFIYIDKNLPLQPILHGGSQERQMRAGTENVSGIVGLAKALEISQNERAQTNKHVKNLKFRLIHQLQQNIPDIFFNGNSNAENESLGHIVNVSLPALENGQNVLSYLDENGIAASGGSACNTGSQSHVLKELPGTIGRENIRFSFSKYNTLTEVDYIIEKLSALYSVNEMELNDFTRAYVKE
jgi:cysteine desulfurase